MKRKYILDDTEVCNISMVPLDHHSSGTMRYFTKNAGPSPYSFVYHAQNGINVFCSSKMNP